MTAANAACGIWAAYAWVKKRALSRRFDWALGFSQASVYLQVALGAYLYSIGLRPKDATHVLYGITPAVAILVLLASKGSFETKRARVWTVACLAFAGMGVRGIMTGFGA